jgi:hypothetical protein
VIHLLSFSPGPSYQQQKKQVSDRSSTTCSHDSFGWVAGLFLLHRQFVFMTISRHPEDPLRSTFGASVQLMFNAAKAVITLVQSATIGTRHPLDRMWYFVDLVFTVAVRLVSRHYPSERLTVYTERDSRGSDPVPECNLCSRRAKPAGCISYTDQ